MASRSGTLTKLSFIRGVFFVLIESMAETVQGCKRRRTPVAAVSLYMIACDCLRNHFALVACGSLFDFGCRRHHCLSSVK